MKRTDLLINRSLASVYKQQSVNPLKTYVVDDNEKQNPDDEFSTEYLDIQEKTEILRTKTLSKRLGLNPEQLPSEYFSTDVIPNTRTHGNSGAGAWNTAAYLARELGQGPLYLAFLDDDDEWKDRYLISCFERISSNRKPVAVFASFMRLGKEGEELVTVMREDLTQDTFFATNPGVQGSNMFIELGTFMEIGGFDESMPSATDRDLCIRLLDHVESTAKEKEIDTLKECLMLHHAYDDSRVSADKEMKQRGLDIFYRKYRHRMSDNVFASSLSRARKLFDYEYRPREG
ncbi:MAG: hypothetical protein E3J35_09510 [Methanomassiliicoccales archaeon]|nr:MAG: hypothetical protein E3J35_09510 [Methanomassiliicoccales archaeon]